jgi:hypothetical protein
MTEVEKLQRDIAALQEANRLDRIELDAKPLTRAEDVAIRADIARRDVELAELIRRRDSDGAGLGDSIAAAAQSVAAGAAHAAEQAHQAVGRDGAEAVREVIRAQPITSALVVFALGYLFGRLGSLIPLSHSRQRVRPARP